MEEQTAQPDVVTGGQERPKGLLYHYTNADALRGIIENKCIWATHVRYLNDESEFVSAWQRLRDKFHEMIRSSDYPHKEGAIEAFSSIHTTILDRPNLTTYFVWCLTDDELIDGFAGDRLSQWRGYSRGKQAFSLGFDYDLLRASFSARQELLRLKILPCGYDNAAQDFVLQKTAETHFQPIIKGIESFIQQKKSQSSVSESTKRLFLDPLLAMFMDFLEPGAFMKDHGFLEEYEWRCVFIAKDNSRCSFRESNFGLTLRSNFACALLHHH
jgi:hypothetical protein